MIEEVIYKCDGCGKRSFEERVGIVEIKQYYCVDCGLILTAKIHRKIERDEDSA